MPCKGAYEGTDGAESDMCEPAARITGTGGMSCSGGRGADCTDRPDAERGRGAPGAPPWVFARLESEPNGNDGSCGAPGPSGGDVALIEGLDRRLAPRGGKAATVEPPIGCTGTVGSWGGGDGPRCQETVSPGSRDILVICETSALPPSAAGGWNSEASDGRGEVAGEDEAEKGLGYRSGGNVLSCDRASDSEDGERASGPAGEDAEGAVVVFLRETAMCKLDPQHCDRDTGRTVRSEIDAVDEILHDLVPGHIRLCMDHKSLLAKDHDGQDIGCAFSDVVLIVNTPPPTLGPLGDHEMLPCKGWVA